MAFAVFTPFTSHFASGPPFPLPRSTSPQLLPRAQPKSRITVTAAAHATPASKALIFDCDGVIVESEELHRVAYNQCWEAEGLPFQWSESFYGDLQNTVGGGVEKMRWYFDNYQAWPDGQPVASPHLAESREHLLLRLAHRKTDLYKALLDAGQAQVRPGVLRLMDEAADRGLRLAICSAANKHAVHRVLHLLVGDARLARFHLIIAGDMVSRKKPDPLIYNIARDRLGVDARDCVVIEDSHIGLMAGLAAGMNVVITHTPYTVSQPFHGATAVYPGLGEHGIDDDAKVITVDSLFPDLVTSAPPV